MRFLFLFGRCRPVVHGLVHPGGVPLAEARRPLGWPGWRVQPLRGHRPPVPSARTLGRPPSIKGIFFNFILFFLSGNELIPEPRDWLLAKLQLRAQLAELGLVVFFIAICSLISLSSGDWKQNSRKSAAGLGDGFVGPAQVCAHVCLRVPPHTVPI